MINFVPFSFAKSRMEKFSELSKDAPRVPLGVPEALAPSPSCVTAESIQVERLRFKQGPSCIIGMKNGLGGRLCFVIPTERQCDIKVNYGEAKLDDGKTIPVYSCSVTYSLRGDPEAYKNVHALDDLMKAIFPRAKLEHPDAAHDELVTNIMIGSEYATIHMQIKTQHNWKKGYSKVVYNGRTSETPEGDALLRGNVSFSPSFSHRDGKLRCRYIVDTIYLGGIVDTSMKPEAPAKKAKTTVVLL